MASVPIMQQLGGNVFLKWLMNLNLLY